MQEMAAINISAKVSAEYGPLPTSNSNHSDETNITLSSRKKKTLRRAGAVNFDEDDANGGDDEMGTSVPNSMNNAATSKYESPARSVKNAAQLAGSNDDDDDDLNVKINFNNHPVVRKSPESAELSEFSTRKSN